MKVIQTLYKNRLFRSRTEARYAVFFDCLNVKWDYEREGYDLDDGDLYLPDFWLPGLQCHIEIKGIEPNDNEIRKCRKLQFHTEADVAIFHGLPNENDGIHFSWSEIDGGSFTESPAVWTIDDGLLAITDYPNGGSQYIEAAAARAKRARFEHGEVPEMAFSRPLTNTVDYENLPF